MKRALDSGEIPATDGESSKRRRLEEEPEREVVPPETPFQNLNGDMLFEVLKHVDARTVAMAACVSRRWRETAQDERLWEMICTRHWANIGCGTQQLRSVVLALGGFRRLHALCLWPLLKSPSMSSTTSSSSSATASASSSVSSSLSKPVVTTPRNTQRSSTTPWGKDEVHLSLCLLSIRYYERMNLNNRGKPN
ncbi:hypothetical protein L1049_024750 [Liquidambar formosana]|uniref:F-box protein GID2 n=1 Tax=Liquidambar formosana TaxID=63359 RepID=A0AAP0RVC5_LIQFO